MSVYDVAVIGGGLIGTAASYFLAGLGARAVVIERGQINSGASGRNAGSLHFQLEPRMADSLSGAPQEVAQLVPLSLQAIEDWRRLSTELGCELEIAMHGGLIVAETDDDRALLERKTELENLFGLRSQLLGPVELRRLAPYLSPKIVAATFCEFEGHANPRLVTPAFARAGAKRGVAYRVETAVAGIRRFEGCWRLSLVASPDDVGCQHASEHASEIIDARSLLIAAGAWSVPILRALGLDLPLWPIALTMSVTERTRPFVGHLIQHMGRRLSLKQAEAGNLIVGGAWPARLIWTGSTLGESRAELLADAIIGNLRVASDVVPAMADLHLIRSWSGIASDTPDHLPLLGRVPGVPEVYIAAGGSSFTLGPTLSRLVSELITMGRTDFDLRTCEPARYLAAA